MRFVVCVTGASGSIYGKRAIEVLAGYGFCVDVIFSSTGKKVFEFELGLKPEEFIESLPSDLVRSYDPDDLFAPVSSGSADFDGVIVVPCSTGTLGHIANGVIGNLIHRTADVALKERKPLVLVVREAPLSRIHIENMLRVVSAGAVVFPASPAFYGKPEKVGDMVDFVVGRALKILTGRDFGIFKKWQGTRSPAEGSSS